MCVAPQQSDDWLVGGGEAGEVIRSMDWSQTPLGPRGLWPPSLRAIVNVVVSSSFPMAILWGKDLIFVYNDAYRIIAGQKHPHALGRSTREVWPEVWAFNQPIFERVMERGETVHLEDQLFRIARNGSSQKREDTYFTLSYSPIRTEDGQVSGTLVTLLETTRRVESQRQSTSLLEAISDSTGDAIFAKDRQGCMTYANPATLALIGKPLDEVLGRADTEFLDDKAAARRVMDNDRRIMDSGRPEELEELVPLPDGSLRVWWSRKTPYRDAEGKVVGLLGVSRDITGRKRTEEALRESEERLKLATEATGYGTFDFYPQSGKLVWSNHAKRHFGLGPDAQVDYGVFLRGLHPDDRERVNEIVLNVLRPESGGAYQTEYRTVGIEDGQLRWLSATGRVFFDDAGRAVRFIGATMDITARKQAEEDRARLAEHRRLALDAARMVAWEYDPATQKVTFSDNAAELLKLPRHQTSAEGYALIHPDDVEHHRALVDQAIATGSCYLSVYRHSQGADVLWLEERGQAVVDRKNGQTVRLVGVVQNITERKQAEQALRENHERLKQVLAVEAVGVMFWDLSTGRLVDANDTFLKLMGYDRHDLETHALTWQKFTPPEYHDISLAEIRKFQETGRVGPYEKEYFCKDGTRRWLLFSGSSLGNHACVEFCIDIADRKKAEQALRERDRRFTALLANLQSGVALVDERGHFVLANDSFRRIFGLSGHVEDINSQDWSRWQVFAETGELLHIDEHPVRKAALTRQRVRDQLVRVKRPSDGRELWLLVSAEPILKRDGQVQSMICTYYDITDRMRMEEDLLAAKSAAEAASCAKDQFIAVLSHELRTPLTPAMAALGLLRTDVRLPHDVREDLEMISRNIDLEVRLIADLLDVSRIISGKLHLEKRAVDVADAIREAAGIVSGDLDAKGQTLTIETPGTPYLTFGDAARLQQVFWNLIRNSIKFSPPRSQIAVRARVEPVEHCPLAAQPCPVEMGDCPLPQASLGNEQPCGGNLVVEVIDQGSGIAPEMLPRLFNAFEQEQKARSFGGLGLGLSICKAVVEMHGGTISARSEGSGCGATFIVRLPIAQCPKSQTTKVVAPAKGDAAAPQASRSRLKIVLVEDHDDTARLMRRLLMTEGHEVIVAASVAAGLTAVRDHTPDLLISDLGLPDGSGLDLMRQLLAEGRRIPAVALSGFGTAADVQSSRDAGFIEHLVKPLSNLDALTEVIAKVNKL